jgi:hypothetical protein
MIQAPRAPVPQIKHTRTTHLSHCAPPQPQPQDALKRLVKIVGVCVIQSAWRAHSLRVKARSKRQHLLAAVGSARGQVMIMMIIAMTAWQFDAIRL